MTNLQMLASKYASSNETNNCYISVTMTMGATEITLKSPTDEKWVDLKNGLFVRSEKSTKARIMYYNIIIMYYLYIFIQE